MFTINLIEFFLILRMSFDFKKKLRISRCDRQKRHSVYFVIFHGECNHFECDSEKMPNTLASQMVL